MARAPGQSNGSSGERTGKVTCHVQGVFPYYHYYYMHTAAIVRTLGNQYTATSDIFYSMAPIITIPNHSKLHIIAQQPNLLARLKRRQSNIRTPITPERIAQRAVPA